MSLPVNNPDVEPSAFIPDKYRATLEQIVGSICENLNGYGDNKTILPIGSPNTAKVPFEEYMDLGWCLEYLAEENIITYTETESEYSIQVINRYKLELLNLPQGAKQSDIPNLVYYNPRTGKGS